MGKILWIDTDDIQPAPDDFCKCDIDKWRLVVEEGQATVVCRECGKSHQSLYDYPEDIWFEQDVTVEIVANRDYYGEVDIEVIIEPDLQETP